MKNWPSCSPSSSCSCTCQAAAAAQGGWGDQKACRRWRDVDCQLNKAANPHLQVGDAFWLRRLGWLAASRDVLPPWRRQDLLQALAECFKVRLLGAQLLRCQQPAQLMAALSVPAPNAQPRFLQELVL